MTDAELGSLWSTLEPGVQCRSRMQKRVLEWLEASETSIAGEWFVLLKVQPVRGLAFAAVGVLSLIFMTPIGWIMAWLLP